jgi:hypothetical protein
MATNVEAPIILRISGSPLDASPFRFEASRQFAFFLSNAKDSQFGHLFDSLRQPLERAGRGLHTTPRYAGRYAETGNRVVPAQTRRKKTTHRCHIKLVVGTAPEEW